MVAIRSQDADKLLAKPPPDIAVFLIHGSDTGLVSERVAALTRHCGRDPSDPFTMVRLSGDAIAADPGRLMDEANSIGLFGGKPLLVVDLTGKDIAPAFEILCEAGAPQAIIIISAGLLRRDSPMRKLCERLKFAVSIECFPDREEDVDRLIETEVRLAGTAIAKDAKQALLALLGADRLSTRSEVQKLLLFTQGEALITLEHVAAVVADASSFAAETLVATAFRGDSEATEAAIHRLLETGTDPAFLIGSALRYAMALDRIRLDARQSGAQEASIERYGRTTGAARFSLAGALPLWGAASLAAITRVLAQAIRQTRRQPALASTIANRAFWSIARAAQSRR